MAVAKEKRDMRERITWKAGRKASAAPATPGYDKEDGDHPAHQADPDALTYENGDPSAWAEDPKTPPYAQGNPPSIPGYDTEDKDHPAHKEMPRVPKEAVSLRAAVEKKAGKCLRIARVMLGKGAKEAAVEDQALDLMDWSDSQIGSTLTRLAGNPLLGQFEDDLEGDGFGLPEDEFMDDGLEAPIDDVVPEDSGYDGIMAEINDLAARVKAMKSGNQNDPKGPTQSPKGKTEEEARKPATEKAARAMFAAMETHGDGFVMAEDWTADKKLFASIDTDHDGIITADEMVATLMGKAGCGSVAGDSLDPEEQAMLAEMEKDGPACGVVAAKKGEEEEVKEEEVEEEEEGAEKEAAMFATTGDPMGLDDGTPILTGNDALLREILGGKKAEDDEEEEAEEDESAEEGADKEAAKKGDEEEEAEEDESAEEGADKEAAKKGEGEEEVEEEEEEEEEEEDTEKKVAKRAAMRKAAALRPQSRKPSKGVRAVGAVTRTASASGEVNELSKLWASAPDVSDVFK